MKIELKSFKFYPSLSEETYCFQANIWVNGTKCGTAENRGCGGETDLMHDCTDKGRKLLREAEAYCLTLPPITWESPSSGKTLELEMNLTRYIDEMVDALVRQKEDAVNARKMAKDMEKAILIGDDKKYRVIGFKMPLKDVWEKYPDYFKQTLKEKLEQYKDKGYRLLNTNIPSNFLI